MVGRAFGGMMQGMQQQMEAAKDLQQQVRPGLGRARG